MRYLVCVFGLLAVGLTSCKRTPQPQGSTETAEKNRGAIVRIDPCSLVTEKEVAEIQGAPITGSTKGDVPDGTFATSQCYYSSSAPDQAVTVGVTQVDPDHPSKRSPRDFWHEMFDKFAEKEGDEGEKREEGVSSREEEKEHEAHPTKIEGCGDEAFWAGSKFGGVLYVLSKDFMLRVSVGGPGNREGKLAKSKALAQKALPRL